jgi:phosphonate transport system substrate-binding protein
MKYSKKFFIVLSLVVISAIFFAACGPADPWKDIGTEKNPILFAAVPSGETERVLSGFEDMADLIYDSTGLVVEPFVATSYAGVIEAMCQDEPKAHMAALATFSYVLAHEKGCADVALVSTRYGSAFYNGQFVVLADSDFETLEDLKGASWCASEKLSTSGYIIPSIMFKGLGIDVETDMGEVVEAGSHEAAMAGVYNGDCDFGTSYVDARGAIEEDYPDIMEMTKVIAVEPDIPNDGIQFVTGFPEDVKATLVKAVLALFETEEGLAAMDAAYQWDGMVEKGDDFYEPFRQILDASGMDIAELAGE